jgi:MFS family permease
VIFGPQPVILLAAATFLAASGTALARRLRERPAPARAHWKAEFTAGMRYISRTAALRRLLVTFVIALTAFGFIETISFAVVSQGLHRTPPFLGALIAILAGGSIAGAACASPLMQRTSERTLIAAGLLTCAGSCPLLTAGLLPVVLAACALLGVSLIWISVAATTLLQRRTPPGLIGRVDSALTLAGSVPQALSIAAGAALAAIVNYRALLIVMAVVSRPQSPTWSASLTRSHARPRRRPASPPERTRCASPPDPRQPAGEGRATHGQAR